MAVEDEDADKEDGVEKDGPSFVSNGKPGTPSAEDEEASEEEEEDEEPRLKYASLTKQLKPVYRNGDATSVFLVAGDKMVSHLPPYPRFWRGTDGVPGNRYT